MIIDELKKYSQYVESLHKSITELSGDIELLQQGWQLQYVIDFSELYYYMHPFWDTRVRSVIQKLPDETDNDAMLREQITLNFILTGLPSKPILLPPYQVELRDHIRLLKYQVEDSKNLRRLDFERALAGEIVNHESFQVLEKTLNGHKGSDVISVEVQYAIIDFIKANFKSLYLLLVLSPELTKDSLDTAASLFRNKTILQYNEAFASLGLDIKEVMIESEKWFSLLRQEEEPRKNYARYLDGIASAYVHLINSKLNPLKKAVFFVTRSRRMPQVLNDKLLAVIDSTGRTLPVIRNLDYFMTYLRMFRKDLGESKIEIKNTEHIIERFQEILTFHKMQEQMRIPRLDEKAKEVFVDLNNNINSRENLNIALGKIGIDANLQRSITANQFISDRNYELARQIYDLVVNNSDIQLSIKSTSLQLLNELNSKFSDVDLLLTGNSKETSRIVEKLSSTFLKKQKTFLLEAMGSEMPIVVKFSDKLAVKYARLLAHKGKKSRSSQSWRLVILDLIEGKIEHPEVNLLRAYIFGLAKDYISAHSELETGLSQNPGENATVELLYLRTVFERIKPETFNGISTCIKGLSIAPNDFRLKRELAVLVWQAWKLKEEDRIKADLLLQEKFGEISSLGLALRFAREAYDSNSPKFLLAQVLNTLIYLLVEDYRISKNKNAFDEALAKMAELEKALGEKYWISRFFDTRGFLSVELCRSGVNVDKNKKMAVRDFHKALEDPELRDYETRLIRNHLDEASALQ